MTRLVWICFHPSVYQQVHETLAEAAINLLAEIKEATTSEAKYDVEIADLRKQLNIFEIMGPKSSQVIKGALRPVMDDKRPEFRKVCMST